MTPSSNSATPTHGIYGSRVNAVGPPSAGGGGGVAEGGFVPGHPLVKDGRRHYGSKSQKLFAVGHSETLYMQYRPMS